MTRADAERMYFIFNQKYGSYWRPKAGGYTTCVLNAGLYTQEDADKGTGRPEDLFLRVEDELKRMGDRCRDSPEQRETCLGWVMGVLR